MAEVACQVGGRTYRLACKDGEEEALRAAAHLLDEKVSGLKDALGAVSEARLLLMAGLLLAGEQIEQTQGDSGDFSAAPTTGTIDIGGADKALTGLLARVEKLANALEAAL